MTNYDRPRPRQRGRLPDQAYYPHQGGGRPPAPGQGKYPKKRLRLHLLLPALLLIGCAAFFYGIAHTQKASSQARLDALHQKQAEELAKFEQRRDRYLNMRKDSGYSQILKRYAEENQVNYSLVSAVVYCESHYDTYAQSSVGARGLMQIMEDTGTWIAGRMKIEGYSYDHLFDPDLNARFGVWLLSYLSDHYQGNPVMAMCAYHAGSGNVDLWALKYADDERFLKLDQIPTPDTKSYVQRVMEAYAYYYQHDIQNP
ncbi:MAG: lytic transglycosylase domain-containing protein [Christensenellales bacterium]|nr:lytic transglycosylase domain-containing protein [Clostridiales bacterium]